jgi:hypothetical protein
MSAAPRTNVGSRSLFRTVCTGYSVFFFLIHKTAWLLKSARDRRLQLFIQQQCPRFGIVVLRKIERLSIAEFDHKIIKKILLIHTAPVI